MAETAMAISFTLILLFGMIQLVALSYFQVAGDAAVFVAAHEYTLGVSPATIASAESSMVPQGIATNVIYTAAPPNPVGSGLFNSIYGNNINNNERDDGYTLVRPQNFTAYLNNSAAFPGILGNLPVNSASVEGYYLMTNQQMNQFGTGPDNSATLGGNYLNAANASPFLPQSDATIANMNTPPYYLPSPVIQVCGDPWQAGGGHTFNTQCGNPHVWFLGLGEFLENSNYAPTSGLTGVSATQAFATMAQHQRIYANLIAAFPAYSGATADLYIGYVQKQFANYNGTTGTLPGSSTPCTPNICGAGYSISGVNLCWYDPMGYWESSATKPSWQPQPLWSNESQKCNFTNDDAGGDGVKNTQGWNGASPALVYEWDQPNFPGAYMLPGNYPPNPTAGGSAAGDPGY